MIGMLDRMIHGRLARPLRSVCLTLGLCLLATAAPAGAAAAAPLWQLDVAANSTVPPSGTLHYFVRATNVGDAAVASPFELTIRLPAGMTSDGITSRTRDDPSDPFSCSGASGASVVTCTSSFFLLPFDFTASELQVSVDGAASGSLTSAFEISGGGAQTQSKTDATTVTNADPGFGVDTFDGSVDADPAGGAFTQAGGHPFAASTFIAFNTIDGPNPLTGPVWPVEQPKDVVVDLPPGFVGDPTGAAQCTAGELANSATATDVRPLCSPASQIGVTTVTITRSSSVDKAVGPLPVFNMVPPPGVPARFGFNALGTVVTLDARLRSDSDYGLSVDVHKISEGLAIAGTSLTIWGVPAASSHDAQRSCPGEHAPSDGGPSCRAGLSPQPFLRNVTSCDAAAGSSVVDGLVTSVHTDSWVHPGRLNADGTPDLTDPNWDNDQFISHLPPGKPEQGPNQLPTDCGRVPFDPALEGQPVAPAQASSPSGFAFDLTMPQSDDPGTIGTGDLRKAVVTLPAGVHVSPSSANGLAACGPDQIGLHTLADPTCPDGSKVGSLTIRTPLLRDPLEGSIYLATPFNNPFNKLIAIYLVARGPGLIVKLAGSVDIDQNTGQLTTTFDNQPQLPFSNLHLEFKGGSRAPLVTPTRCGTYTTHSVLTSWSGKTVEDDSSFTLASDANGTACNPHGFSPEMSAGTANPIAGGTTSFLLGLTRGDLDQELGSLSIDMPEGLLGYISKVQQCGATDARNGTCGSASQIGDVTVGAGAGSSPFYVSGGRAYLTGPYNGAPYGLSIVVPAVAGPFDLGNVNVRSAIFVDKHDSSLRVVSDPLPTILQGIPLDVRDVRVNVNRRGFIVNPTNCARKTVDGVITSTEGARAAVSDRFQVGECASLGFKPRMAITVGGRRHTHRGQTTPLSTTITMPRGKQANLRFVRVTLPDTINARLTVIQDACTRAEFESDIRKCAHARAGSAVASTPLLSKPLRGNAYFVKNGHPIPDLFIALRGDVDFDLIGTISIVNNRLLRTTFATAPDVPIRSFSLRLLGDPKNGSVGAAANLCARSSRRHKVALDFIAQNGRVHQVQQALRVKGCAKHKRGKGAAHRSAR
jgi:hypothetical protein